MAKVATSDNRGALAVAAVVSLLLHAALVLTMQGRPLGKIDLALLRAGEQPFRFTRSEYDQIIEEDSASLAGPSARDRTLEELSRSLLAADPGGDSPPADAPPAVAMRVLAEQRPDEQVTPGQLAVNLPDPLTNRLLPSPDLALGYVSDRGTGVTLGEGGSGTGDGAGVARGLLGAAGLTPGGAPPQPQPPELRDTRLTDDRLIHSRLDAPPIDFAQLALAGTTRLDVPEHLDDDFEYAVTVFEPQPQRTLLGLREPEDKRGYFRVDIRAKRSLSKLATMPKDVVFVIDTSGSIAPAWVAAVSAGVRDALSSLNEGDRFNIVQFKEDLALLSPEGIVPVSPAALERARTFLTQAHSGGYTDVNAAVSRLLVRDVSAERVYNLVLISDGVPTKGVMDTRELINLVTKDNALAASIYCVGVGARQNKELLEFLAYRNRGFCVFVSQAEQAQPAIRALASRLRYPIMKGVELEAAGLRSDEIFPADLPNIHQGEQFSIFGRFDTPGPFTMRLHGHNGPKAMDFTFSRDLSEAPRGTEQIAQDWGFWKLHHLYSEMLRLGDGPEIRRQIRDLTRQYKLKSVYGE